MIELSGCRRIGTPDDIAVVVAFLVSQDLSYIPENDILADGGTVVEFKCCAEVIGGYAKF
jgi:NAD(P)-dependent dehydrogenase (short-subunit alcohol dehydrogenase family)